MNRLFAFLSMTVTMCTVSFAQSSVDKTLMDLEQQWTKAALASKSEAVAPLLTPDFTSVQSDGTIQKKAEYLEGIRKGKWQVNEVSDMKVQVHGDSAVVIGVWTAKGTDGTGKAFEGKERFTDTWVKAPDGKWQCVADASAPMKK
jgi:ketosteroid isomerase-like protein